MMYPRIRAKAGVSQLKPDYEVKMLLAPTAVLGPDRKLTTAVRTAFGIPSKVLKMSVQFLDTDGRDIYDAGWSPRIRKTEGESGFELTYKKRYSIDAGEIDEALARAAADGFDANGGGYEAQIEWGYEKQTLSISRAKSASSSGYAGMDLPDVDASRSMLIDEAPRKFDDWRADRWGTGALGAARIYGPVLAKRHEGRWSDMKLYIEVWPIRDATGTGTTDIVEASFKTTSRKTASSKHDSLMADLRAKGWLLPEDGLKTKTIMDRY
jgi:hypothetical protein